MNAGVTLVVTQPNVGATLVVALFSIVIKTSLWLEDKRSGRSRVRSDGLL